MPRARSEEAHLRVQVGHHSSYRQCTRILHVPVTVMALQEDVKEVQVTPYSGSHHGGTNGQEVQAMVKNQGWLGPRYPFICRSYNVDEGTTPESTTNQRNEPDPP